MRSKRVDAILKFIENDVAVKKHLYRHNWISGSSTEVYPITIDEISPYPRITLQWDNHSRCSMVHLKKRIERKFEGIEVSYDKNDGSCPPVVLIWLNKID